MIVLSSLRSLEEVSEGESVAFRAVVRCGYGLVGVFFDEADGEEFFEGLCVCEGDRDVSAQVGFEL